MVNLDKNYRLYVRSRSTLLLLGESDGNDQERLLSMAYSIDAFACHFLTDAFSSGHIR